MVTPTATRERTRDPSPTTPVLSARPSLLADSILATVAYHDLLDLPLTAVQCWRYLLRPRAAREATGLSTTEGTGHGNRQQATGSIPPTLRDAEATLAALVGRSVLETKHGFVFLPGRSALVEAWIEKHARSQEKWRRLRRIAFWLQALPFLRGIAGTGSLAFDNAKPSSDLDVLIIAAPNRVWTARFFLTVLLDCFRLRRRPRGATKDRVCLNHYLAADALEFPYRSLYTALEYARLVPLVGEETCRAFRAANRPWIETFLVRVFPETLTHRRTIRRSVLLRACQRALEWPFKARVGDWFERLLARTQRSRIARAGATSAPGGRVVATAVRAEFHPHSREAPLLAAFNERMAMLGLAETFGDQRDSGLTSV